MRKTKAKYLQKKEESPKIFAHDSNQKNKKEKVPTFLLMAAKKGGKNINIVAHDSKKRKK